MPVLEKLPVVPLQKPPQATIRVPGSKSITNRALVLAALTGKGYAWALRGALCSEDTELMINALRTLGFRVVADAENSAVFVNSDEEDRIVPAPSGELFTGNSGTTMRFVTALVSLGNGRFRLDGVQRMRERPIEDLLHALRRLGAQAYSERGNGCPPVVVDARGLNGGTVRIKGDISSQFLSGLLMAAPFADNDTGIEVEEPLVSWPYVLMTVQMMMQFGLNVTWNDRGGEGGPVRRFVVPGRQSEKHGDQQSQAQTRVLPGGFDPRLDMWVRDYHIEPDASAAGYFFAAAAIMSGQVTVSKLRKQSLQGDVRFLDLLADMGCEVRETIDGLVAVGKTLRGIEADMNDMSDCVMTLAAVACFTDGPTTIRNVAHIRHKETDRLKALATELRRVGAGVDELPDGLRIHPKTLRGAEIETYNDHRMAMSMALIGLKVPGIVIKNPGCVAKTYPDFFRDLETLRE